MSENNFLNRQDRLKQQLGKLELDGILLTNLTSIRYICGFTGSTASCLITNEGSFFISDGR
ncbi:MAG TPA: aminopeptidase P family protein, partial [Candidatus Marinimicrobia bacterium]|nr:aminopeptidase P family protein [Candidatus Neomarinimicrobiota bacterium]